MELVSRNWSAWGSHRAEFAPVALVSAMGFRTALLDYNLTVPEPKSAQRRSSWSRFLQADFAVGGDVLHGLDFPSRPAHSNIVCLGGGAEAENQNWFARAQITALRAHFPHLQFPPSLEHDPRTDSTAVWGAAIEPQPDPVCAGTGKIVAQQEGRFPITDDN